MQLIQAKGVKKQYGDRLILEFETLSVYEGDKIGLVGLNGAGKTTLLQILSGELLPEEGWVKRFCEISYLRQFGEETLEADPKLLKELQISDKLDNEVLSGGERVRLKLAQTFSADTPVVFADEPTANLDVNGVRLLQKKLERIETFLLISHDRALLNSVCNKILEVEDGTITLYPGNYNSYEEAKRRQTDFQMAEYEQYEAKKSHLEQAITQKKGKARSVKKVPSRMGNSEARLHRREATESEEKLNRSAKTMITRLNQLEQKEKPKELEAIKLDFSLTDPPRNKLIIRGENICFGYGDRLLFNHAKLEVSNGKRIALMGENGAGKTTLFNLIMQNKAGITAVPRATFGYFYQGFENLDPQKTILENVMEYSVQPETTARTILARLLFKREEVHKPVAVLSGGERIKAAFAKLFVSSANVLLLDEPTNYLDIPSVKALQAILSDYSGTLLFISHDLEFVRAIANQLLFLENGTLRLFDGSLHAYEQHRQEKPKQKAKENKLLLEMRLAELISQISISGSSSEKLEAEYQDLLCKIRQL